MYNNIENNKPDLLSDLVRQKLEGHQMPVEPAVWDAIAQNIGAAKPKRRIIFGWWLTAGIAATVALLFVLQPFNNQSTITITKNSSKLPINTIYKNTEIKIPKSSIVTSSSFAKSANIKSNKIDALSERTLTEEPFVLQTNTNSESVIVSNTKKIIEKDSSTFVFDNQVYANIVTETKTNKTDSAKPIEKFENKKLQLKQEDWTDPLKEKQSSDWSLIAMVGSASNASVTNGQLAIQSDFRSILGSMNNNEGIVKAKTSNVYIYPPESFSDKTYTPPVSVGFAVGRKISKNISVETGINYTYLLSIFKSDQVDARLNLHYMGIPVRFVYDFMKSNKWTVYSTAGGAIEKGLWSVYEQNQHYNSSTIITTVKEKIAGLQYSINGSFGGAYSIYKNGSVYFEPKISYFFDTDQPVSIRTVNTIVVGFEGGFRYRF
ncbi:MAG: hypothetical protein ACOYM7_00920 [Paludibacter sp.]